jgi:Tol biopolymer transport system component
MASPVRRPFGKITVLFVASLVAASLQSRSHSAGAGVHLHARTAATSQADSQIVKAKVDGPVRPLTDEGSNVAPAWSPDGNRIAYATATSGTYHIFSMNPDGSGSLQLTTGSADDVDPAWSPNGAKLAFTSNRAGNWNIYTMAADGTGLRQINTSVSADRQAAWSPDGSKLAFTSNRAGNWNVYTVNADATGLHQLTTSPTNEAQPAWSPDGSKIAFTSDRSGTNHVFVIGTGGSGLLPLTRGFAKDYQPAWSPDGSQIAFVSNLDGYLHIYQVPAGGGPVTQVTTDVAEDRQPAWRPTGTALTFARSPAPEPSGAVWGIYSASRNGRSGDEVIATLESEIGRHFNGRRIYQNMSTAHVPTPAMTELAGRGGYIYLNINSFTINSQGQSVCARWADVAGGRLDAQWTQIANEIKGFGYTVHLSFHHEMTANNAHHPACGTASDYVAAYNHLWTLFQRLGVANVRWVWTPVASAFMQGKALQYVPAHFDVVGVDGYSRAGVWRWPSQIFAAAHSFATARHKPFMIGEIGCDDISGNPDLKATWYREATALFRGWSDLSAVMWTNTGSKGHSFWIDSSAESLAVFRQVGVGFR